MKHEPTVEEIVDRIMATECGQQFEVALDPNVTRVANLEWLLPICAAQLGTTVSIAERPENNQVVLTIQVLSVRQHAFAN
ncbi:MAG TPA: hypothetical protein VFX76_11925 [Roseiflexaceae bacterium]|nr:hypothetical protein [Roseiflexaceae bacterium]